MKIFSIKNVLVGMASICMTSSYVSAQYLPDDYMSKVSYYDKKEVTYELVNSEGVNCLTLSERAKFHGYSQFYKMTELVDQEGDLLTDKVFIDEQNVRDEWMEDFSRITVAKDSVYVFGEDDSVFHTIAADSNKMYLTTEQGLNYGLVKMDNGYYETVAMELMNNDFAVEHSSNMLVANSDFMTVFMDKVTKVSGVTLYDSNGNKVEEQLVKYEVYSQEDQLYYPENESLIEWFWSENKCCVRRTTSVKRMGFLKEFGAAVSEPFQQKKKDSHNSEMATGDVKILVEQNTSAFRIVSQEFSGKPLEVVVYDMNGKEVLNTEVLEGSRVQIPEQNRAGMYVIHLKYMNRHLPVSGKIIKPTSSKSF